MSNLNPLGLETIPQPVLGRTYPLYGMITSIISDTDNKLIVEINKSIKATMVISDQKTRELVKSRAFEPGIFIAMVTHTQPLAVSCETVVFGLPNKMCA